jgi:hypothetical protein
LPAIVKAPPPIAKVLSLVAKVLLILQRRGQNGSRYKMYHRSHRMDHHAGPKVGANCRGFMIMIWSRGSRKIERTMVTQET